MQKVILPKSLRLLLLTILPCLTSTSEAQVNDRIEYSVTVEDLSTRNVTIKVVLKQLVQPESLDFEYVYLFREPVICPEGTECDSYQSDVSGPNVTEEYQMTGLVPAAMYKFKFYLRNLLTGELIIEDSTDRKEIEVTFCTKPGLPNVVSYEGRIYRLVDSNFSECVTVKLKPEKENVKYNYTVHGASYEVSQQLLSNEFTHCHLVDEESEKADIEVQLVTDCKGGDVSGEISAFTITEFDVSPTGIGPLAPESDVFGHGIKPASAESDVFGHGIKPASAGSEVFPLGFKPAAPVDVIGITSTWWSQSIARITWTTSQESYQSHDRFLVYLNQQLVAEEHLSEKSFSIDGLDLCKNYFVRVGAVFRYQEGKSYEKHIRNWNDPAGVKEILDEYPDALEKCGKCSNIEKNQTCSFPFTWDSVKYNTCTTRIRSDKQDGTDKQLKCLTLEDEEISCSILPHCLPPLPTLYGMTIQTIAIGAVAMSWKASSDELNSYKIYLNGEEKSSTTSSEYKLTNLTASDEYEFEVKVSSFGRIGQPERIAFVASDKKVNAFALNQTTESADIIWEESEDNEPGETSTKVNITVAKKPLLQKLLGDSGFKNLSKEINIAENSTKLSLVHLVAGVKYSVTVTKTVTGESKSTNPTALQTAVTTIPRPLRKEENGLVLAASNGTEGLELSGFITANTYSEKLNFVFTVQNVSAIVEKDGEYSYIAGVEETKSSVEDTCITEDCVEGDNVNFVRTAFDGDLIKGGVYVVDAISQTGNAEAEMDSLCYVAPPNPVELFRVYSVTAYQIKFSWDPPPTGLFQGFIVEYIDHSGNLIEEELGGYLRYSADELEPGYSYTFNVFAIAKKLNDDAELVKSNATQIQQDAEPLRPKEVASEHNIYENKFEIFVEPPAEGNWHHFEVTYDDLNNPVGEKEAVFAFGAVTGEMKFDRYGAVYQLKVWAVSTNGVKSRYPTENKLLTDPEEIRDVVLILKTDTEMCFLWKLEKDNSTYHKITGNIIQGSVEFASQTMEVETEQTSGVFCFDVSEVNETMVVRLEMITTVEYPPHVIAQSKDVVSYPNTDPNGPKIEYELGTEFTCETEKCSVFVDPRQLPLVGVTINYRLVKQESTGRSRRNITEISGEFKGSECPEGSSTCTFTLDNLAAGNYEMYLTVFFYGVQVGEEKNVTSQPPTVTPQPPTVTPQPPTVTPQPPTVTPQPPTVTPQPPTVTPQPPTVTTQPPPDPDWYFYVLIGAGVFVIVIVVAIVVWACTRSSRAIPQPPTTDHPRDSGAYDEPNPEDVYENSKLDCEYDVPNPDYNYERPYGNHEIDYQHPKYANHIYEKPMKVADEIRMKFEYAEASLNSGVAPSDAKQVEVNVEAAGEQGGRDESHDPRYV